MWFMDWWLHCVPAESSRSFLQHPTAVNASAKHGQPWDPAAALHQNLHIAASTTSKSIQCAAVIVGGARTEAAVSCSAAELAACGRKRFTNLEPVHTMSEVLVCAHVLHLVIPPGHYRLVNVCCLEKAGLCLPATTISTAARLLAADVTFSSLHVGAAMAAEKWQAVSCVVTLGTYLSPLRWCEFLCV